MGEERQRVRRVSVTVREGPRIEGPSSNKVEEAVHDVFNCCSTTCTCHYRKSLAGETIRSRSFSSLAETMEFARESMVCVAPSVGGHDGDKFCFGNLTSPQEDENLDDFQRAVRCLQSDYKTFAASNFDRFIKEDEKRAMNEVWPQLERELRKTAATPSTASLTEPTSFPESFHQPASKKFPFAVIDLYNSGNGAGARKIISLIIELIPSENAEISGYWTDCLGKLIEACHSDNVQKDIYPKIVELATGTKSVAANGKVGACRLLRKLAKRFNAEVIERRVFPMMDTLAKDKNPEVRAAAAASFPEMCHRLQDKSEALKLINIIMEDTTAEVRAALTSTIVKSVTLMNPREEKNKVYLESVMQTIKTLVKGAYVRGNIDLLVAYSQYMGIVCQAFTAAAIMKGRDILWYLDAFLQLSKFDAKKEPENVKVEELPTGFANFRANMEFARRHSIVEALISTKPAQSEQSASLATVNKNKQLAEMRENAGTRRMSVPYGGGIPASVGLKFFGPEQQRSHECRVNAAKQFYDFMVFAKPVVGFKHGLHPLVTDLLHDKKPEVRAAMAEKLFPIMDYLAQEAGVLHGELVYVLSEDDLDVIQAVVPHLSGILKCLVTAKVLSPEKVTPKLVEIGGAILYCEERLNQTTFYKVHQTMLEQFIVLPFCLPGDYVYSNFVPALFHRLRHMRVLPCRRAAANAIITFLRHCRRSAQREDIRNRIKSGFVQGRSVHDRMLFLYMAKKIIEQFSRKYFRDHFFEDVLLLAKDPVGNVRRKAVEFMPQLKTIVEDPALRKKLEDTFFTASKLELDRDVKATIDEIGAKLNFKLTKSEPSEKEKEKQVKKAKKSTAGAALDNKKKITIVDPMDQVKEMEEEFIESMESQLAGQGNENFNERRRSFYGTGIIKGIAAKLSKAV